MYDPVVGGKPLQFGISGWLYQSTAILYDRQTESLWPQIGGTAISGRYRGQTLRKVAAQDTEWGVWRAAHPDTLVLSTNTGYDRSYGINMYYDVQSRGAEAGPTVLTDTSDDRLPPQTQVFALDVAGAWKVYPVPALREAPTAFTDRVGEAVVEITNDPPGVGFIARTADGRELPHVSVYWYAWAAVHEGTAVYTAPTDVVAAGTPTAE